MSNENISELTTSCYKNFEEIENLRKVQEQISIQEENKIEVEDKTRAFKGIINYLQFFTYIINLAIIKINLF